MVTLTSELAQRIPPTHKVSFEEYIEWLDEVTSIAPKSFPASG
jgi:hypothetical protein